MPAVGRCSAGCGAARPGCVAFIVDPVPAPQPDLERLTDGRNLDHRMVLSRGGHRASSCGRPTTANPIMHLAWSSVESTGMGFFSSRTEPWLAIFDSELRSARGRRSPSTSPEAGSIHFEAPGPRLPLDVLSDLAATREDPREPRMLED